MVKQIQIFGERCSGTNYLCQLIIKNFEIEMTRLYGHKHFFGYVSIEDGKKNNEFKTKDVLFVCISRNLKDWLNSFFREQHHLPREFIEKKNDRQNGIEYFLTQPIHSLLEDIWDKKYTNNMWPKKDTDYVKYYNCNCNCNDKLVQQSQESQSNQSTQSSQSSQSLVKADFNIYNGKEYRNIFELRNTKLKFMRETLPSLVENVLFIKYKDLNKDLEAVLTKIKNFGVPLRNKHLFPENVMYYKDLKNIKFSDVPRAEERVTQKDIERYCPREYLEYENELEN